MAETFLNIVGSFFIRELTGDQRNLRLSARALPYRPLTFETEQRMETTWNPGSPTASQQKLGKSLPTSSFNGFWKDRFIGEEIELTNPGFGSEQAPSAAVNGAAITNVVDLADLVDDMTGKGQTVEVSWLHIARLGTLKKFTQIWHNIHDLEWTLEIEWSGASQDAALTGLQRETNLSEVAQKTSAAAAELDAVAILGGDSGFNPTYADRINAAVGNVVGAALDLEDAVIAHVDGVTGTLDATANMLSILDFVATSANDTIATCYRQVDRATVAVGIPSIAALQHHECVAASARNRGIARAARAARHTASRQKFAAIRRAEGDLLGVYFAREGDDLRSVSLFFYRSADEWMTLRSFNHLRGSHLVAGQVLLIPKLGSQQS